MTLKGRFRRLPPWGATVFGKLWAYPGRGKADIARPETRMLKIAIGIVVANTGLAVALIKLLPWAAP